MTASAPRWAPQVGLSYVERLTGAHYDERSPHRQLSLAVTLHARASSLLGLVRTRAVDVSGELEATDLATRAAVKGQIRLAEGALARIVYAIDFVDDRGRHLALRAHKRFDPRDPYATLTVLTGSIADERGEVLASCLLRFDARSDLGAYLRSVRLSFVR